MFKISKIYSNKQFINLLLNIINVRICKNETIQNDNFVIRVNNAEEQKDNPVITMRAMMYICCLLTENGLNSDTLLISSNKLQGKFGTIYRTNFKNSLDYIKSINYDYEYNSAWKHDISIIREYEYKRGYFKIIFSKDFIDLLGISRTQFYEVPESLFNENILRNRNVIFIANYVLIHQRRNRQTKKAIRRNTISIQKLIENCPLLPKYDNLSKYRQVSRNIIKPFERDLDIVCNLLGVCWSYVKEKPANYIQFYNSKITITEQKSTVDIADL